MPSDGSTETAFALRCEECGTEADGTARGWRAFLTDGEHEPEEIVVYCGDCSDKEFGDA